ncbi:rCG33338 [Rattus norvegicus]|uniref:RCG33338 n=1 Tax=Rattus norvegicus TaxID=10116 RepID=A6HJP5_RAT|nr:rCG33338 [Rattus norvegicus]
MTQVTNPLPGSPQAHLLPTHLSQEAKEKPGKPKGRLWGP